MKKIYTLLIFILSIIQTTYSQSLSNNDILKTIGKDEKELMVLINKSGIQPFIKVRDNNDKSIFFGTQCCILITNGIVSTIYFEIDEKTYRSNKIPMLYVFSSKDNKTHYYYVGFLNNYYVYMTFFVKDNNVQTTFFADSKKRH